MRVDCLRGRLRVDGARGHVMDGGWLAPARVDGGCGRVVGCGRARLRINGMGARVIKGR